MGCKYVSEFEYPEGHGFSGSAGKQHVRGYVRGGRVAKCDVSSPAKKAEVSSPSKGVGKGAVKR